MLKREGYYSNRKADLGGETYRGVSRVYWPAWEGWLIVDARKVTLDRPLKQNEKIPSPLLDKLVLEFYQEHFWDSIYAAQIKSDALVDLIFDSHVIAGKRAIKWLQEAINEVGGNVLRVDWGMGLKTLKRLDEVDNRLVFERVKELREERHRWVAANVIDQHENLDGWLHRVQKFQWKPNCACVGTCQKCAAGRQSAGRHSAGRHSA